MDKEKDKSIQIVEDSVELYDKTGQLPVFKTVEEYANMTKERFVVPQNVIVEILKDYTLSEELQKKAVNKMVDRTPHFLDLTEEERLNEIKSVLTLESVAYYLYDMNMIEEHCNMYENGFDKEGNIVLDAFYVNEEFELNKLKKERIQKRKARILDFQQEKRKRGKENG